MTTEEADDTVFQVVMLPVLRAAFEEWLASRRAYLFLMPTSAQDDDDLPTYGIGIKP